MKIANLNNEVHFKNVFTDVEIFTAFVKDVLGISIEIEKVETEKMLPSKVSPIKFKMDLFAEDTDQRTIVEIQKVDYDYTYDRFSHYFFANIIDLQSDSKTYSAKKDVYVIVVVTSAYKLKDKNGKVITDDILLTDTNPCTLQGDKRYMHDHKMVILNAVNTTDNTPEPIKDWLDLIVESMKDEQDLSKINQSKKAIAKAIRIAERDQLTPEQRAESKIQEMRKITLALREAEAVKDDRIEAILKFHKNGVAIPIIAASYDMTEVEVEEIIQENAR